MRAISRAADRMLNALAPKIIADASSCTPSGAIVYQCACDDGTLYTQTCYLNGECELLCGPCHLNPSGCYNG